MKNLDTLKSKIRKLKNELSEFSASISNYWIENFTILNRVCELQNEIASLSNTNVSNVLRDVAEDITYASADCSTKTLCQYLEAMLNDLANGMDAENVIDKYEQILNENSK